MCSAHCAISPFDRSARSVDRSPLEKLATHPSMCDLLGLPLVINDTVSHSLVVIGHSLALSLATGHSLLTAPFNYLYYANVLQ
jgi:hypothetical protein